MSTRWRALCAKYCHIEGRHKRMSRTVPIKWVLVWSAVVSANPAAWAETLPSPPGSASTTPVTAPPSSASEARLAAGTRFLVAYPDHLSAIDGNTVIWKDGTRMTIDDGEGRKPFEAWLERPDLEDTLQKPYSTGAPVVAPAVNDDPGRARSAAFFDKMYGDCRKDEVARHLTDVVWLPRKSGSTLKVTTINGVAARLSSISRALDALPSRFDAFLSPAAGTYNCRVIAGTGRVSAHGHGIAIDIALKHADYWRWGKPARDGRWPYRNRIPQEIVDIFEAHGFIWGGRWYHFDTMHFEYRPELLPGFDPAPPP